MEKPMPNLGFKLMRLVFRVCDFFQPRIKVLREVGIEPGFSVLDYGCGPGIYITPLAELAGSSGKIHTLDIHPLAAKGVEKLAAQKGLHNIETILSDCKTGLPDSSINVVLLYDTFHNLSVSGDILQEMHRILKPGGRLSFGDYHMKEDNIVRGVTGEGMFTLSGKGKETYSFSKAGQR
jgi:ubiquinone/menaquinone biosynthesis C-methylase UbiE